MDPRKVDSPQDKWRLQEILFTKYGDSDVEARGGTWSIACGLWYDESGAGCPVIAIRWNGEGDELGYPNSGGHATWLILPELVGPVVAALAVAFNALKK